MDKFQCWFLKQKSAQPSLSETMLEHSDDYKGEFEKLIKSRGCLFLISNSTRYDKHTSHLRLAFIHIYSISKDRSHL